MNAAAAGPLMGVVADDLTGAADVASVVADHVAAVLLWSAPVAPRAGGPADPQASRGDILVAGLRIRTAAAPVAVRAARSEAERMLKADVPLLYSKYCSTFDSTDAGNIGPVADALADLSGERCTVVCPAYPSLGRTVVDGRLFVYGVPLDETSMAHHPLTPMTDSDLVRLMSRQTSRGVGAIPLEVVRAGAPAVRSAHDGVAATGARYVVVDAEQDRDLDIIAAALDGARLATGGAGLAGALAARRATLAGRASDRATGVRAQEPARAPRGPLVILAGSCSAATIGQVERFRRDHPARALDPGSAVDDPVMVADGAMRWVVEHPGANALLIHATAGPDEVRDAQARHGTERVARALETTIGAIAAGLVDAGIDRLLVAGGETSGAVLEALGHPTLAVGEPLAPGIPWLRARVSGHPIRIALKSGNFGDPDLFLRAIGSSA